jgi:hypothetical protein
MKKLREVLLTQYIGAITIGFVLAQMIIAVVSGIVQIGVNYTWASREPSSVMGGAATVAFPWKTIVYLLVTAVLELLIAFILIRWLYTEDEPDASIAPQNQPEETE